MQEFRERQAVISKAESLAASYASREAALATREQKVSDQEDSAQQANAAAEYARTEADAMWQKQKVVSPAWLKGGEEGCWGSFGSLLDESCVQRVVIC